MIKKILWVPQFSTTIDGKFNITSDSNWRYFSDMVEGFKKVDSSIIIHVIVPSDKQLIDKKHLFEAKANKFIPINMYVHAFAQRFDFDYNAWVNILSKEDYDVIWINDPALVMNIKSVYGVIKKDIPLIVSYNHWPDNPLSPKTPMYMSYFFRQIEGAIYSDLHFVNSEFSKQFLLDGARKLFRDDIVNNLSKKVFAAYCPIIEIPNLNIKHPVKIIAYTQRLSDLPYYKKSFDNAISILSSVYKIDQDFVFRIFNHANKPISKEISNLPFVEIVYPKNRDEYYTLLSECYLSLDCYDDERVWSISQNEACNLGVMPMLRWIDGYKEMYGKNFGGFYTTNDSAIKKIVYALKHDMWVSNEVKSAKQFMLNMFNEYVVANLAYNRMLAVFDSKNEDKLSKIIKNKYGVLK